MRYVWSCYVDMIDTMNIYQKVSAEDEVKFLIMNDPKVSRHAERLGDRGVIESFSLIEPNYDITLKNFTANPNTLQSSVTTNLFVNIPSTARFIGESNNLRTCPAQLIDRLVDKIQAEVNRKRISLDVNECKISNLQIAQTVALPRPFAEYWRIFRYLEPFKDSRIKGEFANSTIYFHAPNTSEFKIYDKGLQLRLRQDKIQSIGEEMGIPSTRSLIRFEHKIEGKERIQKILKVSSINQLITKAPMIENKSNKSLQSALSRLNLPDVEASFENEVSKLLLNLEDYSHRNLDQTIIQLFILLSHFEPGHMANKIQRMRGSVRRNSKRFHSNVRKVAKTVNPQLSAQDSELRNELIGSLQNPIILTQSDFEREDKVLQFTLNSEAS